MNEAYRFVLNFFRSISSEKKCTYVRIFLTINFWWTKFESYFAYIELIERDNSSLFIVRRTIRLKFFVQFRIKKVYIYIYIYFCNFWWTKFESYIVRADKRTRQLRYALRFRHLSLCFLFVVNEAYDSFQIFRSISNKCNVYVLLQFLMNEIYTRERTLFEGHCLLTIKCYF